MSEMLQNGICKFGCIHFKLPNTHLYNWSETIMNTLYLHKSFAFQSSTLIFYTFMKSPHRLSVVLSQR